MKKKFTIALMLVMAIALTIPSFSSKPAIVPANPTVASLNINEAQVLPKDMVQMGVEQFLSLTPSKYKEMTGKKLGIKKSIELKAAQKMVKHQLKRDADISKGLYVVLAILGFGWLAMGLMDNWSGSDWIINLILTFLCWLPGVIHALVKMKKYYN